VGPRANLDDMEIRKFFTLLGLELQPLDCPGGSRCYTDYAIPRVESVHEVFSILKGTVPFSPQNQRILLCR
jgi:hypothetical protein